QVFVQVFNKALNCVFVLSCHVSILSVIASRCGHGVRCNAGIVCCSLGIGCVPDGKIKRERGMRSTIVAIAVLAVGLAQAVAMAAPKKVLVYTRNHVTNGSGYVHDNIATSVEAIKKIGAEQGFGVDVSDDPAVFTDANLRQYRTLIFSNSNNEAFENDAQREAFRRFIHHGGGFVGVHSASGSER